MFKKFVIAALFAATAIAFAGTTDTFAFERPGKDLIEREKEERQAVADKEEWRKYTYESYGDAIALWERRTRDSIDESRGRDKDSVEKAVDLFHFAANQNDKELAYFNGYNSRDQFFGDEAGRKAFFENWNQEWDDYFATH